MVFSNNKTIILPPYSIMNTQISYYTRDSIVYQYNLYQAEIIEEKEKYFSDNYTNIQHRLNIKSTARSTTIVKHLTCKLINTSAFSVYRQDIMIFLYIFIIILASLETENNRNLSYIATLPWKGKDLSQHTDIITILSKHLLY